MLPNYHIENIVTCSVEIFEDEYNDCLEINACYSLTYKPYEEHLLATVPYDDEEKAFFIAKMYEYQLLLKYGNEKVAYTTYVSNDYNMYSDIDVPEWEDIDCLE